MTKKVDSCKSYYMQHIYTFLHILHNTHNVHFPFVNIAIANNIYLAKNPYFNKNGTEGQDKLIFVLPTGIIHLNIKDLR